MARKKPTLDSGLPLASTDEEREKRDTQKRLATWKQRVERARKCRKDWERDFKVEECENFFLGQHHPLARRGKDPVFNHYKATIKTQRPNLFYTAPKFFVRPKPGLRAPAEESTATIGEGVLDAIGSQGKNLKRSASLALLQAFFRVGCLKTVYDPKMQPNPCAGEPIYLTMDGEPVKDEQGLPIQMVDPLTGQGLVEQKEVITDEAYRYEFVDAKCLLLPDEGPDMSKWTFIGEEITVPLEDAKKDARFPEDLRKQFTANAKNKSTDGKRTKDTTEDDEQFRYVEIYAIKEKRRLIWADGQDFDDFLLDEVLPKGIEDHPYSILRELGDPILGPEPSPWPCPKTYDWLDPQREYNINRKQVSNGAKRSARKVYYDDGTFASVDEAVKSLQSSDDMTAVKINDSAKPPTMVTDPPLPPDIYKSIQLLMTDWRIITGQTGARMSDAEGGTATESTFVERAANLRDAGDQDVVNDWLSDAGAKMLQLVKGTLTMDLWIKLRGFSDTELLKHVERSYGIPADQMLMLQQQLPGFKEMFKQRFGQEQWKRVTREELTFEADVQVVPGSARPRNLEAEKRAFLDFWTLVAQYPMLAMSVGWLKEAARMFEGLITEAVVEEVHAMSMQWIAMQANQAGRNQGAQQGATEGGDKNGGGQGSTAGQPDVGALLAGIQGGLG